MAARPSLILDNLPLLPALTIALEARLRPKTSLVLVRLAASCSTSFL